MCEDLRLEASDFVGRCRKLGMCLYLGKCNLRGGDVMLDFGRGLEVAVRVFLCR